MLDFVRRAIHRENDADQLRKALRRQIGSCPVCGKGLDGHSYWDIASIRVGSPEEAYVAELIKRHAWTAAAEHQQANATDDIRVWRAVRCPSGVVAIMPVTLAFEAWSPDEVGLGLVLDEADSRQLMHAAAGRWRPL